MEFAAAAPPLKDALEWARGQTRDSRAAVPKKIVSEQVV